MFLVIVDDEEEESAFSKRAEWRSIYRFRAAGFDYRTGSATKGNGVRLDRSRREVKLRGRMNGREVEKKREGKVKKAKRSMEKRRKC